MIRFAFLVIGCLVAMKGVSQNNSSYLHNRTMLERMGSQGVIGNIVPLDRSDGLLTVVGEIYLNRDYRNASFELYGQDKLAEWYPAKLDLQRNEFDIRYGNDLRALAGNLVKTVCWKDSVTNMPMYLVNGKEYKNELDVPYVGFFQILTEGELNLLKMVDLIFKEADQAMANSVGNKDNRFIKKPGLYYSKGKMAYKLPSRSGIMALFHSKKEEMKKFMKINEIDISKESHLFAVFNHYNSLVAK